MCLRGGPAWRVSGSNNNGSRKVRKGFIIVLRHLFGH
jgi:hypothetical protein